MKNIQSKYYLRHLFIALLGEFVINGFLLYLAIHLGYEDGTTIGFVLAVIFHASLFMVAPAIFIILENQSLKKDTLIN